MKKPISEATMEVWIALLNSPGKDSTPEDIGRKLGRSRYSVARSMTALNNRGMVVPYYSDQHSGHSHFQRRYKAVEV